MLGVNLNKPFEIEVTSEYDELVSFLIENELEFDAEEEVDTDIIRCYKILDDRSNLAAAAVLAKREEKFIIDGIAVADKYRDKKIGTKLLKRLIEDTKELKGKSLYLVARAPGFFFANGFQRIEPKAAPNFFECKECPQYMNTCNPEIMKIDIK